MNVFAAEVLELDHEGLIWGAAIPDNQNAGGAEKRFHGTAVALTRIPPSATFGRDAY